MKTLSWLIAAKTALILLFILYGGIGLGPDEAQYWTWSRHLAPGYYSKPPGIAFQIAFGTAFFGQTELGVRFGSLLAGAVLPFLIWFLAKAAGLKEKTAFFAALIWAFSPLGFIGSFLAITDVGLILFWTLSAILLLRYGPTPWLGLAVALGALFKWPMYLFWVVAIAAQGKPKEYKRWLLAFSLSLLALIPPLLWNGSHNFVTFRHVEATLQGGSGVKAAGNFWEFFGAQMGLLTPLFFLLMLLAYPHSQSPRFVRWASLPPLLLGGMLALFMKMQGNWAIWAYPTAALLAAEGGESTPVSGSGDLPFRSS